MARLFVSLVAASSLAAGSSPIAKVLDLLSKMEQEIKSEMTADAATSKKLQCWAATNRKEKTEAIAAAETSVSETSALIENLTGSTEQQKVQVAKLTKDLAEDEKDLAKLEKDRAKEGDAFRKYELETTQSVQQLNGAIQILKKHQGGASALAQLRKALSAASLSFPDLASLEESKSAVALLEYSPHASVSGEIFGVLTQMLEQMDSDLSARQKEEADAVETFNKMRKAKKEEIADTLAALRKKKDSLAKGLEELAQAKKSIKATSDQLEVDRKFLADVNARSAEDKQELASRVASQTEELKAIKETVAILTSEDSRAHFEKTKPTSFLQTLQRNTKSTFTNEIDVRQRASFALRKVNNPELALLSSQVQLAAFDEVKKMIADLIKDLKAKKAAEIEKRDYCIAEFDTNKKESDETTNLIEDLGSSVAELDAKSKALAKEIESTVKSQKKLQISTATATTVRVEQSNEYQQLFNDYLTTKDILNKAIIRLNEFYGKSFLAQEPAPVGLTKGGFKKKNGGGVIGMIRMIIEDSKKAALQAQADEIAAAKAYEAAMTDARTDAATLKATLVSKKDEQSKTDADLLQAKDDQTAAIHKLDDLQTVNKNLHSECDFLTANFENRQAGFDQESEALQQAIDILSGAQ